MSACKVRTDMFLQLLYHQIIIITDTDPHSFVCPRLSNETGLYYTLQYVKLQKGLHEKTISDDFWSLSENGWWSHCWQGAVCYKRITAVITTVSLLVGVLFYFIKLPAYASSIFTDIILSSGMQMPVVLKKMTER